MPSVVTVLNYSFEQCVLCEPMSAAVIYSTVLDISFVSLLLNFFFLPFHPFSLLLHCFSLSLFPFFSPVYRHFIPLLFPLYFPFLFPAPPVSDLFSSFIVLQCLLFFFLFFFPLLLVLLCSHHLLLLSFLKYPHSFSRLLSSFISPTLSSFL